MKIKDSIKNILIERLQSKCQITEIEDIAKQINYTIDSFITVLDQGNNPIQLHIDDIGLIVRNPDDTRYAVFYVEDKKFSKIMSYQETLDLVNEDFIIYDRHNLVNKTKIRKIDSAKCLLFVDDELKEPLTVSVRCMDAIKKSVSKQDDLAHIRNQSKKAKSLGKSILFFLQ